MASVRKYLFCLPPWGVFAFLVCLVACADATGPQRDMQTLSPRRIVLPPSDGSIQVLVTQGGPGTQLGPYYDHKIVVQLSASGTSEGVNGNQNSSVHSASIPAGGFQMPDGTWHGCLTINSDEDDRTGWLGSTSARTYVTWRGQMTAWGSCGWNVSDPWTFTGGAVISYARVPVSLNVTSDKDWAKKDSLIIFTAQVTPDTVTNVGANKVPIPLEMLWTWKPDSGPAITGMCDWGSSAILRTCYYKPATSGTMWYTGVANAKSDSAGKHVTVVRCPINDPTDSIVDRPEFRSALKTIWQNSDPDGPIFNRRERGFKGFSRTIGGQTIIENWINKTNLTDTPCRNVGTPSDSAIGKLAYAVHSHPFAKGDSLPSNCRDEKVPSNKYTRYGGQFGGPSANDWALAAADTAPQYVIDKDSLYRAGPITPSDIEYDDASDSYYPKDYLSKYKAWSRKRPDGCDILD